MYSQAISETLKSASYPKTHEGFPNLVVSSLHQVQNFDLLWKSFVFRV